MKERRSRSGKSRKGRDATPAGRSRARKGKDEARPAEESRAPATPPQPSGSDAPRETGDLLDSLGGGAERRPEDQEARDLIRTALDETIVVEAAAGTGKTTMLVARIVALLESGRAEVDRIVAVTFTEKAAGELKLRIREKLETARQEARGDAARAANLERAVTRLEEAWVGTIHGFCADLLRERSITANVDPDFRTLTEPEAAKLFQESFDLWLQQVLESPPEGVRRSLRRGFNTLDEDGPVGRLRQAAWTLAEWRDFPHPWRRDPFAREDWIDRIVTDLHRFAADTAACRQPERDNLYKDTEKFRRASEEIENAERVRPRDYDGLEAALIELKQGYAPRKGYGKEYGPGIAREDLLASHAGLVRAIEEFQTRADADLAALLQTELQEAVRRYEARKVRLGLLDFVDLLIRARDLIRGDVEVRREFQERFTHIFVDEFQDTDPIQAEILMLLSADDPETWTWQFVRPRKGKLFVVGDPKQSIYRFRRADVGIYTQVRDILLRHGARALHLTTNFRSCCNIQTAINAAFTPWMKGDRATLQPDYVPLTPWRPDPPEWPTLVALPVPRPYGFRNVTKKAIESSLPGAVASFVRWLLEESGRTVREVVTAGTDESEDATRGPAAVPASTPGERERPIEAKDVCLLFRRFDNFFIGDVTRGYVRALEAEGIRHLLVGGRSFHEREEVETLRTALTAIEWPDDELAVFATLRGAFFAIGDEELFEYRKTRGKLHPFRQRGGEELPERLQPIEEALDLLGELHRARNRRPIADTVSALLEMTRAHAAFVLRPSGDQVLANVLHVAEQARSYESTGGISFRGFVEELLADADRRTAPEAPILEEGSEGVRIMTVHRAKGLEFPIVILCDLSANLGAKNANRYLEADRRFCVSRLAGWSPVELLEHQDEEIGRDRAEGIRIAYVAATRARDLLVVPAVGDGPFGDPPGGDLASASWLFPLNGALYPPKSDWGRASPAPGAPPLGGATVLDRPESSPFDFETVRPGLHEIRTDGADATRQVHEVVWWDATLLGDDVEPVFGVRREDLMRKEAAPEVVGADLDRYRDWLSQRERMLDEGAQPSLRLGTVTERARRLAAESGRRLEAPVEVYEIPRAADRPGGPRFGALVHALLATVPLTSTRDDLDRAARVQARLLGALDEEIHAAVVAVERALEHDILARARAASGSPGGCLREAAVTAREADGRILDGVVDLAFLEDGVWVVVDFKTDRELEPNLGAYKRQVALYAAMVARATKKEARAVLLGV